MVSPAVRNLMIFIYSILIISIIATIVFFTRKPSVKSTPSIPTYPIPHPQPHPHPFPQPHPQPSTGSYFFKDKTFNNQPLTPCIKNLIQEFRRLADPVEIQMTDKGGTLPILFSKGNQNIRSAWRKLCNGLNNGIKTCSDMRVRYIVPKGAGEQIELINKNGTISVPGDSEFHCEDLNILPIYFRLNHKGAGVTIAVNFPCMGDPNDCRNRRGI